MKNIQKDNGGFGHIEGLAVVIVIAIIGLVIFRVVDSNSDTDSSANVQVERSDELPSEFVASFSPQDAISVAEAENADAVVSTVDLESEDGVAVYKIVFEDGSVISVNAATGELKRYIDEDGEVIIDADDDFDDDGIDNDEDDDDDNDGETDAEDTDDDNDGQDDTEDVDDDNDGIEDTEDDNNDEDSNIDTDEEAEDSDAQADEDEQDEDTDEQ